MTLSLLLFDPSGVGIDFARCSVGYTHGYSNSGPFGARPSKRHTLIQRPWSQGEGERSWQSNCSGLASSAFVETNSSGV